MGTQDGTPPDPRIELTSDRLLVYTFLSEMFEREVTIEHLKGLQNEDSVIMRIGTKGPGDERLLKGLQMMNNYMMDARERDLNQVKVELAAEYANLFLGVKDKPLHPSESVYMSEDRVMYQEPRDRVLRIYSDARVSKVKEYTEPEDHIAVELEFMAYLCGKTLEALKVGEGEKEEQLFGIQKQFLDEHLCAWVPKLTKDILETSSVDFYRGLAYATEGFLRLDRDSLERSTEELGR